MYMCGLEAQKLAVKPAACSPELGTFRLAPGLERMELRLKPSEIRRYLAVLVLGGKTARLIGGKEAQGGQAFPRQL